MKSEEGTIQSIYKKQKKQCFQPALVGSCGVFTRPLKDPSRALPRSEQDLSAGFAAQFNLHFKQ
jgi:hypothetical protein